MNNESFTNNNMQTGTVSESVTNQPIPNTVPTQAQPAATVPVNPTQPVQAPTAEKKTGGKIIFNDDPISFDIKEVEEKNEENGDIPVSNTPEEKVELPTEQSGNITF